MASPSMSYVYVLGSDRAPDRFYVGRTADLKRRIAEHNAGKSRHTKKFAPWSLISYFGFSDAGTAEAFEAYLKTSSGRAFARKRLGARGGAAPTPMRRA